MQNGLPKRVLRDHIVNPANDKLKITVCDEPGSGGANHHYEIEGFERGRNPSAAGLCEEDCLVILFQNGPINEVGVNGITHEALLAILIDRLKGFQRGPFACGANAAALNHLEAARDVLLQRTRERMARNVEGTHKV